MFQYYRLFFLWYGASLSDSIMVVTIADSNQIKEFYVRSQLQILNIKTVKAYIILTRIVESGPLIKII